MAATAPAPVNQAGPASATDGASLEELRAAYGVAPVDPAMLA